MENLGEIKKVGDEFTLIVNEDEVVKRIKKSMEHLHLSDHNKYTPANNDILVNELILRLLVEIFINKIELEDNKPYIVNAKVSNENYRFSVTKLVVDNDTKYMYGLIMY